ncbi:hypothetical protein [Rheinheimera faecalis]|uniref:hypothetical protein n=1 Tax=Rheinheimera faecalis TaxID=2901141 RepID=UPI001E2E7B18|nr:hypothetical protein [Rheinheimera faecalis]
MNQQKPVSLITKEQWAAIEKEMSGGWVSIKFSYKGHEISVSRERKNESTTVLTVYIDGVIKGGWACLIDKKPDDMPEFLPQVWSTKTISLYSPKKIAELEKSVGKRMAKKYVPNLHAKTQMYLPYFSKASVLCRQFKKLEGLELTHASFLNKPEPEPS